MSSRRAQFIGVALTVALLGLPMPARARDEPSTTEEAGPPATPSPPRVRVVLNAAWWVGSNPTYGDTRSFDEFAEQTTLRTSYATGSGLGPDIAVQVSVYRGFGLRAGFSSARRDATGTLDVSRPNPLYFDRPRTASTEQGGLEYTERAVHLDLAYGRTVGRLDWSLFAGVTLFRVEAELFGEPTFTDVYPFEELTIASTPTVAADSSPTGFNVGGGLDYRFGRSGRFGLGVQLLYSTANVELRATPDSGTSSFEAGGLQAAAGIRIFF